MLRLALALAVVGLCVPAAADDEKCVPGSYGCGHRENHEQYMKWHREVPDSSGHRMHCCKEGDCRPTRATKGNPYRPGEDEDSWYAWTGSRWTKVPPEAMLKPDILNDGRSHVCAPEGEWTVYCFSPTGSKG